MVTAVSAVLLALAAGAVVEAPPPDETNEFVLTNGRTLFGWIVEDRGADLRIRIDAPWDGPPREMLLPHRMIERGPLPERRQDRDRRIEEGWRERGFEPVDSPGGRIWLPAAEVDLARRALEAEAAVRPPPFEPVPELDEAAPVVIDEDPVEVPPFEEPGPLTRRGPQLLLGVVAVALVALIVKGLLL